MIIFQYISSKLLLEIILILYLRMCPILIFDIEVAFKLFRRVASSAFMLESHVLQVHII